jgi:hypothetical protein
MLPLKQLGTPVTLVANAAGVAETADAGTLLIINATAAVVNFQAQTTNAVATANGMPIPPNSSILFDISETAAFWAATGVVTVVPVEVQHL